MLFTASTGASATTLKPIKAIIKIAQIDSSKVQLRHFNNAAIKQYLGDKDFQYQEYLTVTPNWWTRFWRWIWNFIENLFRNNRHMHPAYNVFKYLLLATAIGVLVFIIFKIIGIDLIKIFRGESKNIEIPYAETLENIHDISFDNELEKAIANKNYRLAVRLLYLRSLKQLSDAQLIYWQIEKTNTAYLNELTDAQQRQSFGLLTRQFEYIWYGDFPVDGQSFKNISTLFQDFKRLI
jgi:ABC-type dipeptide/oligopeptide/nickel transport system permease component